MGRLPVRGESGNLKSVLKKKYFDDYFYMDYENVDPTFFTLHQEQFFHVESEKIDRTRVLTKSK